MDVTPQRLADRIIAIASDFVGLVETSSNAHWDDPQTPWADNVKDAWLRKWMAKVPGWSPGAAYCVAFDGAVIANALQQLGVDPAKFLKSWTAHVMTNVRMLRALGLLDNTETIGGVWLARHGASDNGHAGVVAGHQMTTIVTIEGNTAAGPTANQEQQRQGDGIWLRTQHRGGRGDLHTQGFVSPASILKLAT